MNTCHILVCLAIGLFSQPFCEAVEKGDSYHQVSLKKVIDGDTILLKDDQSVRLVGIDTPEKGEPYYKEAKTFLIKSLSGRRMKLKPCLQQSRDHYGRLLARVSIDGRDAGAALLRQGLARTLLIGPCGRHLARDYQIQERRAFRAGLGIWSLQIPRRIIQHQAGRYTGWLLFVTGRVRNIHQGSKALHLNYGQDYRTDFTVVVFRRDLTRLTQEGLLPIQDYKGKRLVVLGRIQQYNGPAIIIDSADQIALNP